MMKVPPFSVSGLSRSVDGVTTWSAHSLELDGGPQLCMGRPMTYSSAFVNSVINSAESLRISFCWYVRDPLGVQFAETHVASTTGMSIVVRSRLATAPPWFSESHLCANSSVRRREMAVSPNGLEFDSTPSHITPACAVNNRRRYARTPIYVRLLSLSLLGTCIRSAVQGYYVSSATS